MSSPTRPALPAVIRVLNFDQAAEVLGVSRTTLWEYAQNYPDFPVSKLGGKTFRIREDLLLDWVGSRIGLEPVPTSASTGTAIQQLRRLRKDASSVRH